MFNFTLRVNRIHDLKRNKLNQEELNKIIEIIESSNSIDDAYLGLYQYGGGPEESFAKANKEGLELFAAQLLKASRDFDNVILDEEKSVIPLDYEEDWIDGDIYIQYVEPINKKGQQIREEENIKENIINKLVPYGCIGGVILIIISAIIGLISIFKWLF